MNWESWIIETVSRALIYGTPMLLGTLGEIYAERSGVLNLGVEGMMLVGALTGFAVAMRTGHPWLGVLVAGCVGAVFSVIHAFASITLRANQVVSGLALTFLGMGLSGVIGRAYEGLPLWSKLGKVSIPLLEKIPILGPAVFQGQYPLTYIAIGLAILMWFVLYKTRIGISIRAGGEDPATADSLGINVSRVRYLCVMVGGFLAGVAGAYWSVAYRTAWSGGMTAGLGWIVIALTIFAFWNPLWALGGAFFFAAMRVLSFRLQAWLPPELLNAMPYILAIVVLIVVSRGTLQKQMGAPSALSLPYTRGED